PLPSGGDVGEHPPVTAGHPPRQRPASGAQRFSSHRCRSDPDLAAAAADVRDGHFSQMGQKGLELTVITRDATVPYTQSHVTNPAPAFRAALHGKWARASIQVPRTARMAHVRGHQMAGPPTFMQVRPKHSGPRRSRYAQRILPTDYLRALMTAA